MLDSWFIHSYSLGARQLHCGHRVPTMWSWLIWLNYILQKIWIWLLSHVLAQDQLGKRTLCGETCLMGYTRGLPSAITFPSFDDCCIQHPYTVHVHPGIYCMWVLYRTVFEACRVLLCELLADFTHAFQDVSTEAILQFRPVPVYGCHPKDYGLLEILNPPGTHNIAMKKQNAIKPCVVEHI